jgi:ribosome recycling factor
MDEYLEAASEDMVDVLARLKLELSKVRTGRATPKLLDPVQVTVASYGATMPLNQLATVQAPDARLLTVTPWDKTTITDIERAIVAAGLGLNPMSDGQIVRVPVPPLTSERRDGLVRGVRKAGEDAKVSVRRVRREYNETFKQGEKDGEVSEDELRRLLEKVQDLTNDYVKGVDALIDAKVAEVSEV